MSRKKHVTRKFSTGSANQHIEQTPQTFSENKGLVLGVGFSGDECFLTVMGLDNGEILEKESVKFDLPNGPKIKNKELEKIARSIADVSKHSTGDFRCLGLALPSRIRRQNLKGEDILTDRLSKIFGCDAFYACDATASGFAEKRSKSALYVHSDVGEVAAFKDGMIYEPEAGKDLEKYLRSWDQYGVVAASKDLVSKGLGTDMVKMSEGSLDGINLDVVLAAAEKHDMLAEDIVRMSALALGVRIAYLANIFDVDTVILGGGIEKNEGGFMNYVKESAEKFLLKKRTGDFNILPGVVGKEASSVGAALLCRRETFIKAMEG